MSDSLMPFQPLIDEPANILPSSNSDGSMMLAGKVTCCCTPRTSTKRRSMNSTLWSLLSSSTVSSDSGDCLWVCERLSIVGANRVPSQPSVQVIVLHGTGARAPVSPHANGEEFVMIAPLWGASFRGAAIERAYRIREA